MAIAKMMDIETRTELQADVERIQRLVGLVASFSRDLHQQIRIAVRKHGADAIVEQIGCLKDDLQALCDSAIVFVEKGTDEKLPAIDIRGAIGKEIEK